MGHYDCRECGTFGCFGECMTPEDHARRNQQLKEQAERAARSKADREAKWVEESKAILDLELERRKAVSISIQTLIHQGKWDDKYNSLLN